MQLNDLVPSIEDMSDEELQMRLIELRKRREKVPTKKIQLEKNKNTKSLNKAEKVIEDLIGSMSPEDLVKFLEKTLAAGVK